MPSPEKNILALDMAKQTGFALSNSTCIATWAHKYDDDLGVAASQFENEISGLIRLNCCGYIYAEAPVPAAGKTTQAVLLRHLGMHVILRKVCFSTGTPLTFVRCDEWRKFFIGRARAPKEIKSSYLRRKWLKQAVKEECNRRGWFPETDDAADALGILSFALSGEGTSCVDAAGSRASSREGKTKETHAGKRKGSAAAQGKSASKRNSKAAILQPPEHKGCVGAQL